MDRWRNWDAAVRRKNLCRRFESNQRTHKIEDCVSDHNFFKLPRLELNNNFFSTQIRTALKKKAFEDAGLPVRQINTVQMQATQQPMQQQIIKQPSEVTLNMLNAAESEVDVEGLHEEVKLEFDPANEEVTA